MPEDATPRSMSPVGKDPGYPAQDMTPRGNNNGVEINELDNVDTLSAANTLTTTSREA